MGSSCKNGVCTVTVTPKNNMRFVLNKVKIQCVRKTDVLESLAERQRVRVDPFRSMFFAVRKNMKTLFTLLSRWIHRQSCY